MILQKISNKLKRVTASNYFWPIYCAILITLFGAAWAPGLWSLFSSPGQIGDSYGGFTALVTGLSLVGIALNLYYQRKDTDTQVKMLSQQLSEAKESKDALAHQVIETERLSKITALHSKLTFFSQPSIAGSSLIQNSISVEMYEHDVGTEVKRLISAIDQLTGYRGKRIVNINMGQYDVCRVWCTDIPYPKIKITPLDITNHQVSIRVEFPPGYQYELLRVNEIHPGELFSHGPDQSKNKIGESLTLTGEDQLHFNLSMDWGLLPHSKNYDITFRSAPHINSSCIVDQ